MKHVETHKIFNKLKQKEKKMKKLVCGLVGVIAAVNSVSALTTEEIRQRCRSSRNHVWDAINQKCIPENPCTVSGWSAYCNKMFADVQLEARGDAKLLIDLYLKEYGLTCKDIIYTEPGTFGQDYCRCHLSNGGYMEFEFDDLNDITPSDAAKGLADGLCAIYAHNYLYRCPDDRTGFWCCDGVSSDVCFRKMLGESYDDTKEECHINIKQVYDARRSIE